MLHLNVHIVLSSIDFGHLARQQALGAVAEPAVALFGDQRLAQLLGLLITVVIQILLWVVVKMLRYGKEYSIHK